LWWIEDSAWKHIDGRERLKTPLSDHLHELFTIWGSSFAALAPDFERMFEFYEVLGSLTHLEDTSKQDIQAALTNDQNFARMPLGRTAWHTANAEKIIATLQKDPMKSALIKAGFARGDGEFLDAFISNFQRIAGRMRFM
jgi:hypothetical protein